MPFDPPQPEGQRIAVIGGGISGLAAAWLLSEHNHVVLIEKAARLGGHARTVLAGKRGDQPVDTGFIVFNRVNYPNLTALFERLAVPVVPSNMSFGASFEGGACEFCFSSLDQIFATRHNIANPRFLRMLRDILRFNARAEAAVAGAPEDLTIGQLCERLRLGEWFRERYLEPLSGAIWSTPKAKIMEFPARAMVAFFRNHALLGYRGQHQWWTVRGGSIEYVKRLETALRARGVEIRLSAPVVAVKRDARGPSVRLWRGDWERFDAIVLAVHSDEALAVLSDPSTDERAALSAIGYQDNEAVLHADPSMMPRRRKVWSSWNYVERGPEDREKISLTYWMNSLQPIPKDDPLFVTLNSTRPIRDDLIFDTYVFRHPVYSVAAFRAQAQVRSFNGARKTWFCGAWMHNGFHEDGFQSALEVATAMQRTKAVAA